MAYDESPFSIVHQTDVYEIRHYADRLAVQATYTNQNSSFRNLFNYISGANIDSQKILIKDEQDESLKENYEERYKLD